jgi:hypothetical protein
VFSANTLRCIYHEWTEFQIFSKFSPSPIP